MFTSIYIITLLTPQVKRNVDLRHKSIDINPCNMLLCG